MGKTSRSVTEARALLMRGEREFLILRRDTGEDAVWEFPGGVAEPKESPEAALRRWCKGLLGVTINFVYGQPPFQHNFGTHVVTYRYYECRLNSGQPQTSGCAEVRWVLAPQLRDYVFDEPTQGVVDWLLGDGKPEK